MQLNDKTAILTGASSGLGAAIGRALTKKGVKVYGLARNAGALSELREELGANFCPVRMDITHEETVSDWVDDTFNLDNIPDILINNAGVGGFEKIDEMTSEYWHKMVDTNLNGMYFITAKVAALMKQTEASTHILNIGSILGTLGRAEGAAYCATKFAISGFSEALFKELRFANIKVTCLNPGSIDTEFFKSSGVKNHPNMLQPDDLAATAVHILETPENMLINEMTVRPLNPKKPKS